MIRLVNLPQPTTPMFQDDKYRVVWAGSGHRVERMADGHLITGIVASEKLAEQDLRNLYPSRWGARRDRHPEVDRRNRKGMT